MLFNRFKNKEYNDNEIIAPISGHIIPTSELSDMTFRDELLGQTLAIKPSLDYLTLVAPANGTLEVMFPTGHAYAIRLSNGLGILIHVGINTVNLKGKGFKVIAKKGETVKAGQPIVKADFNYFDEQGLDYTVMMIITDNEGNRIEYTCDSYVKAKEIIAKL